LPVPLAPLAIEIQDTWLVAVQLQDDVVVTVTFAAPPLAVGVALVGDTVKLQGAGVAAAWVIVTTRPAAVNVPLLGDVATFGSTLYPTLPLPVPSLPDVM
jgi:hypothetical protein